MTRLWASRGFWAATCVAAVLVRIYLMTTTAGTNDIHTWQSFGRSIHDGGLFTLYRANAEYNHPPLMGLWASLAWTLSGKSARWFPFTFKLLPLAGDCLAASLLYGERRRRAGAAGARDSAPLRLACAFLWNPASILVTGYHGNTDPLLAALCLGAALFAARGKVLEAGLFLGGAFNVKVVALLLVLPFACSVRGRRELVRFGAGLSLACAPFLPPLLAVGAPMRAHVFGYNSAPGMWGVNLLLTDLADLRPMASALTVARTTFLDDARYLILAAAIGLAVAGRLRLREAPPKWLELAALVFCLSLVLAPGFGFQYLVWPLPLFFALDVRRAVITSLVAGVFLGALYLYFWDGHSPATSWCSVWPRFGVVWGAFVWLSLLDWSIRLGREITGTGDPTPASQVAAVM